MINKIKYSFLKNSLKKPIYLIFFVTSKCNSSCKHCFYSKELNNQFEADLSLEEIEIFSRELGKLVWLDLSGGEPFLREDLVELCRIFIKNNKLDVLSIPTNGILTEKIYSDVLKLLQEKKLKELNINLSIEGPKQIHDEIRGVKCFDRVVQTYKKLAPLKKRFPKLSIMVSTVITNKNYKLLEQFHKQIKKDMPAIDFHNLEIMRGDPKNKNYSAPSVEQLEQLRPTVFKIWQSYDYYRSRFQARIADKTKKILFENYLKIMKTRKQPWQCFAGRVHAVLDYKGDISVCELLPAIGNIRKQTFTEIWDSKRARVMKASIKAKKCTCTHSCFQITNLIFNQFYWPKLIF